MTEDFKPLAEEQTLVSRAGRLKVLLSRLEGSTNRKEEIQVLQKRIDRSEAERKSDFERQLQDVKRSDTESIFRRMLLDVHPDRFQSGESAQATLLAKKLSSLRERLLKKDAQAIRAAIRAVEELFEGKVFSASDESARLENGGVDAYFENLAARIADIQTRIAEVMREQAEGRLRGESIEAYHTALEELDRQRVSLLWLHEPYRQYQEGLVEQAKDQAAIQHAEGYMRELDRKLASLHQRYVDILALESKTIGVAARVRRDCEAAERGDAALLGLQQKMRDIVHLRTPLEPWRFLPQTYQGWWVQHYDQSYADVYSEHERRRFELWTPYARVSAELGSIHHQKALLERQRTQNVEHRQQTSQALRVVQARAADGRVWIERKRAELERMATQAGY